MMIVLLSGLGLFAKMKIANYKIISTFVQVLTMHNVSCVSFSVCLCLFLSVEWSYGFQGVYSSKLFIYFIFRYSSVCNLCYFARNKNRAVLKQETNLIQGEKK